MKSPSVPVFPRSRSFRFLALSGALTACAESATSSDKRASDTHQTAGDGDDGSASGNSGGTGSGGGDNVPGGSTSSGGQASAGTGAASAIEDLSVCDGAALVWKTARKSNYTSYPDPESEECIEYNGCTWAGLFAGCEGKQSEAWVAKTNIAAVFPDYDSLAHHQLCLRSGEMRMIVRVIDQCADSDCDGCCTENKGDQDELIDLESATNERWGLPDGSIEWADLGPVLPEACE